MMELFDDEVNRLDTSVIFEQSNEEGSSTLKIPFFQVISHEEHLKSSGNLSTSKNF